MEYVALIAFLIFGYVATEVAPMESSDVARLVKKYAYIAAELAVIVAGFAIGRWFGLVVALCIIFGRKLYRLL